MSSFSTKLSPGAMCLRWLLLVSLVLPAAFLRLPLAHHDVEHYIGPDEGELVDNVLEMLKTDDWDHRHRGYPALNFYVLRFAFGASLRSMEPPRGPQDIPLVDRAHFYRLARQVGLGLSLLAALLAAGVCWSFGSFFSSVVGALLVAYSPLVFRESQVANPDLFLLFFSSVSLYCTLRLLELASPARFALAGAAAAMAMSSKYTGGALVAVLIVAWMVAPKRRVWSLVVGLGTALIVFGIVNPYTLLNAAQSSVGLSHHLSYYQGSSNAAWELVRLSVTRGLGPAGFIAALLGAVLVNPRKNRQVLVVGSLVFVLLAVFVAFGRAFPRHAILLVLPLSVLAGWGLASLSRRAGWRWRLVQATLCVLAVAPQVARSVVLSRAASRASPAERAHAWAVERLPEGSRVLQDQFTPSWEGRFDVYRFRVEDRVFAGGFDWVMHSGYPPGLPIERLRSVARFETDDSLGSPIEVFQVPDRESLMGTTLSVGDNRVRLRAGQLPFFGEGWSAPEPGAFATSRLSTGDTAEVFFVVADPDPVQVLALTVSSSVSTGSEPLRYELSLNGRHLGSVELATDAPHSNTFHSSGFRRGLNELRFEFAETRRMNRRHPSTAIRLFEVGIERLP